VSQRLSSITIENVYAPNKQKKLSLSNWVWANPKVLSALDLKAEADLTEDEADLTKVMKKQMHYKPPLRHTDSRKEYCESKGSIEQSKSP
jgi:hypothetical protein